MVGEADPTMRQIVDNTERVKVLIGEICTGTGEQTGGLADVGHSVEPPDEMTQQKAALVEQTLAAIQRTQAGAGDSVYRVV